MFVILYKVTGLKAKSVAMAFKIINFDLNY